MASYGNEPTRMDEMCHALLSYLMILDDGDDLKEQALKSAYPILADVDGHDFRTEVEGLRNAMSSLVHEAAGRLLPSGYEARALATALHDKHCMCKGDKKCEWNYESWDSYGGARSEYLHKARELISEIGYQRARKLVERGLI